MTLKNSRAKGWKNRRFTITMLEEQGYLVGVVERTGRFVFPKDLFGLFDLIAVKKDKVKFIQVSTNQPHPHKPFKEFRKVIGNVLEMEQWTWRDKKKIKKGETKLKIFTY